MSQKPVEALIALLATSLGEESAREIVIRESAAAGLKECTTREELVLVLRRVEMLRGTAGLAARLALTRIDRGVPLLRDDESSIVSPSAKPNPKTITIEQLAQMLAQTLGDEQASLVIHRAMMELRIRGAKLEKEQAVALLDAIARQGGPVGTVARFAKVRLLLDRDR